MRNAGCAGSPACTPTLIRRSFPAIARCMATAHESAATGLPQVTVPAGFIGGRYPVGVSLLGRMWDDEAAAYRERDLHGEEGVTGTIADLFPLYAGVPDAGHENVRRAH